VALVGTRQIDLQRGAILPVEKLLKLLVEVGFEMKCRVRHLGVAQHPPAVDMHTVLANGQLGPVIMMDCMLMQAIEERLRLIDGDVDFTTLTVKSTDDPETDHDTNVDMKTRHLLYVSLQIVCWI
jgi:hypothetical protein